MSLNNEYLSPGKKSWLTKLAKRAGTSQIDTNQTSPVLTDCINTAALPTNPIITKNPVYSKFNLSSKYHYDDKSDTYVTYLKSGPISISGETHRAMHKAYSDWAGKEATVADISSEFGMPVGLFTEYKTVHNWTHSQDPFTKEEIESKPVEDLVDEAIALKRKEVILKAEEKNSKETKEAAEKWFSYERSTLKYIHNALQNHKPYNVPKLNIAQADEPYALVLPVMDLHYGKYASSLETGNSYSRAEARELLHSHTNKILNRACNFGRPEKIFSTVGSDFCHIDNTLGTTTKGTPQDMDGTPGLILKEALELAVDHIDMLREVAPVELILCSGNHDEYTSLALLMYLKAWYRNCSDVKVQFSFLPRNYTSYGNTLIATSHGDEMKIPDLCRLIPYEARELWAANENAVLYTGHKHYEYSNDDSGVLVQQSSSLSGSDRWHNKKGYKMSRRALIGYIIYKATGPGGQITSAMTESEKLGLK